MALAFSPHFCKPVLTMFEACVAQGSLWKKLIDSIKDLVNEANLDCGPGGISIQALDTSHVALVNLVLHADGFQTYQCERNNILGLNLVSFAKVLKTTEGTDTITLRHEDDSDIIVLVAESNDGQRKSEYQLKLMEIEAESMGIPDMEYRSVISLSSSEFAKICRDMAIFGDTVTIHVTREGVKFSAIGDIGEGFAFLRAGGKADDQRIKPEVKAEIKAEVKTEVKAEVKPEVKSEVKPETVKNENTADDDVPLAEKLAEKVKAKVNKAEKETEKTSTGGEGVFITMDEPVTLSFALRYLNTFAKGSSLCERVNLHLAKDSPCMIEYRIQGVGFLRYYLAPKVDDGAE